MLAECDGDGFGTGGRVQFGENGHEVLLDAVDGNAELPGDVFGAESAGGRVEDFLLACR